MSRYADTVAIGADIAAGMAPTLDSEGSELAIIGALLSAPHLAEDVCAGLSSKRFSSPPLALVMGAISRLASEGKSCDPALIGHALGADLLFDRWGGVGRLMDLRDTGSAADLDAHIAAVNDRHGRRALQQLCADVALKSADTAEGEFQALLAELEARAGELGRNGSTSSHYVAAAVLVREAIDYAQTRSGVPDFPFGLTDLDALTGGMEAGRVSLIGGRPGMAKTVAAQMIAKANAMAGKGTILHSLEMSAHPMGIRLACDLAYRRGGVIYSGLSDYGFNPTLDRALKNDLSAAQWNALREAEDIARNLPLVYDTRPGLTVQEIEASARRQYRLWERQGIEPGPLLFDHIGKVRHSATHRGDLRTGFAGVSRDLSEAAKRLSVPTVGMAQLTRGVESRDDKRPTLTDLREAGQLEEDATQVIFLYRPEYYLRKPESAEDFEAEAERERKLAEVRNQLFWLGQLLQPRLQGHLADHRMIEQAVATQHPAAQSGGPYLAPGLDVAAEAGMFREGRVIVRKRPGGHLMPGGHPKVQTGAPGPVIQGRIEFRPAQAGDINHHPREILQIAISRGHGITLRHHPTCQSRIAAQRTSMKVLI